MNDSLCGAAAILGLLAATQGCGGAALGAPPVTPLVLAHAQKQSPAATQVSLEHGREVFGSHCQKCHELPSVDEEAIADWPARLDDMAKRAGLQKEDHDAVLQYLLAAHK